MLKKYDDFLDIKEEIDKYFNILNENKILEEVEEQIKEITKGLLFIKKFMENFDLENKHYKKFAIYDLLMIMHCLTQDSIRNFYNYYRSFIENYIRINLKLSDEDELSVNKIFKSFKVTYKSELRLPIIEYLKLEYSKSCNYVHSNIKANLNLHNYYKDILKSNEVGISKRKNMVQEVKILVDNCVKFIVLSHSEELENIFFRCKQELRFLIGEEKYSLFKDITK